MEKKANESQEESLERKRKDAANMNTRRANETPQLMLQMTRKRANETEEEMIERKRENAGKMTRKTANETEEEMIERKRENAGRTTRKREKRIERKRVNNQRMSAKHNESNMDVVMKNFHSHVEVGPVCVCTVCHRLMYRGVVKVKVSRYKKSSELLQKVFAVKFHIKSFNKQEWICKTCDLARMRGKWHFRLKQMDYL